MYSFIKLVRGRDAKKRCVAHLTPGYDSGCGIDRGSLEGAQKLNKLSDRAGGVLDKRCCITLRVLCKKIWYNNITKYWYLKIK